MPRPYYRRNIHYQSVGRILWVTGRLRFDTTLSYRSSDTTMTEFCIGVSCLHQMHVSSGVNMFIRICLAHANNKMTGNMDTSIHTNVKSTQAQTSGQLCTLAVHTRKTTQGLVISNK